MGCSNGDENLKTKYCAKSYSTIKNSMKSQLFTKKEKLNYWWNMLLLKGVLKTSRINNPTIEEITCENAH